MRARSEGGFSESKFVEKMKSLFVTVPKGKILLQQNTHYQGSFEPWRYF